VAINLHQRSLVVPGDPDPVSRRGTSESERHRFLENETQVPDAAARKRVIMSRDSQGYVGRRNEYRGHTPLCAVRIGDDSRHGTRLSAGPAVLIEHGLRVRGAELPVPL